MLARYSLKSPEAADAIEKAVEAVLVSGVRTADLGGSASTSDMTEAVIARL